MKTYRERDGISQSSLKDILVHPLFYKNRVNKTSKSLNMGSLVDCLLLTPEDFKENYYINDNADPSDVIKQILQNTYESYKSVPVLDIDLEILNQCKNLKYRLTQSDEVKLKFIKKHFNYFTLLAESDNKIIITKEDYDKACELSKIVNQDPTINKEVFSLGKHQENIFQKEIYWEYEGVSLKSLLDIVTIDHKKKTIQPWDLKTTGFPVADFVKSFWKYRYDFQSSFYSEGAAFEYPGYKIEPFRFIVVSTVLQDRPRIFECSDRVLSVGKNGDEKYKGWVEALNILKFHKQTNIWNDTKHNIEAGGIIPII